MDTTPQPVISVKNLVKNFGTLSAVKNISFDVMPKEIFGFLGPNGAGKSTTIKILTTILESTSGDIRLNGFDPTKNPEAVRRSFGIVFQDPTLDSDLTAYENMEYHAVLYSVPKSVYLGRIKELMELVELWDRRKSFVRDFSGGMKRRLEIARGLLHHPKVFFLDEPTVGLDPQTRNHIWSYIQELNKREGTTIFFTTHYMDEAERQASRIAIVDHGTIVATGTPTELKTRTKTQSLEDAFLALTGKVIRTEEGSAADAMRTHARLWRR